jgi:hypothetical protein
MWDGKARDVEGPIEVNLNDLVPLVRNHVVDRIRDTPIVFGGHAMASFNGLLSGG